MYLIITLDAALHGMVRMVNVPNHNIRCCITGRMVNVPNINITLDVALQEEW